jgi:hypothetical protein
VTPEKKRREE